MTRVTRPDISRDQLRRELRADSAENAAGLRSLQPVIEALFSSPTSGHNRAATLFGRRRFLTIGGISVATAGLLAACAESHDAGIARVGDAPTATPLLEAVVNDVVLLRTASSLEHSAIAVYESALANSDLLDAAAFGDVVKRFRDDHQAHAALFEQMTKDLGGEPWTCGNPRFDEVVVAPVLRAITGAPATNLLPATAPSDDMRRDVLNFAHALESIAGSTYQGLVPALSLPNLRKDVVLVGAQEARHAALLAILITGRPDGYADPSDVQNATLVAPTTTAAPTTTQNIAAPTTQAGAQAPPDATAILPVYAMPGTFGLLSQVQLVLGRPNEAGTRLTVNIETPSLNSYIYEFIEPTCA